MLSDAFLPIRWEYMELSQWEPTIRILDPHEYDVSEALDKTIRQKKGTKGIRLGKGESNIPMFVDDMIL